jgi:hypothetical protein
MINLRVFACDFAACLSSPVASTVVLLVSSMLYSMFSSSDDCSLTSMLRSVIISFINTISLLNL